MYAILDIETTGGAYDEEGITEIAIYRFDGHQIVDQFISLINPERPIQPFVAKLTGINNKMLRNAPKFYEVAKRILEITEDAVLVAHNAVFDYRMLKTEFRRLGYDYQRKNICTVEIAQKLLPNEESFKLGKLVRSLGIPMSDRHRANGDALATVELFKVLLNKDSKKEIITQAIQTGVVDQLSSRLLRILDELPTEVGVYYIHDAQGHIIYLGRSKNIKRKVNQHFTGTNAKSKRIQKEVHTVTFEKTGNELIAALKEWHEREKLKPKIRSKKGFRRPSFQAYTMNNGQGYKTVLIEKISSRGRTSGLSFGSYQEARKIVSKMTQEFQLCARLNQLDKVEMVCSLTSEHSCQGACFIEEESQLYNERVEKAFASYALKDRSIALIDKGRTIDEKSVILIENGAYKGYGFVKLNHQLNNIAILRTLINPHSDSKVMKQLIQTYRWTKNVRIIELQTNA